MPYIEAGKSKLYYEDYGKGPAVVLAHGVGGNHASWFNQVPKLAKSYRVIVIDQRAFGNSTDVEGLGRSAFVDDLKLLLDTLGIERAFLVGQSMGGGTAAAFTCRYPERVIALAICDSLAAVKLDEPHATALAELNASTRDLSQAERVLGKTTLANEPELTLLYLQIASFNSVTLKTVKGTPVSWTPAALAKTGVPVLCLVGEEDVICTPPLIRVVHEQIPGSGYVELKRAGHSAYFETPKAFNEALQAFLSQHA